MQAYGIFQHDRKQLQMSLSCTCKYFEVIIYHVILPRHVKVNNMSRLPFAVSFKSSKLEPVTRDAGTGGGGGGGKRGGRPSCFLPGVAMGGGRGHKFPLGFKNILVKYYANCFIWSNLRI